MLLTLFASVIGVIAWALREVVRVMMTPPETDILRRHRVAPPVDQWDPNHPLFLKRAGQ